MEQTNIKLISGYHLTATEKKSIAQMVKMGFIRANNKPNTKSYEIVKGEPDGEKWHLTVRIGSKGTWTIGADPKWQFQTVIVATN